MKKIILDFFKKGLKFFKKGFRVYYLLVATIVLITIATQSIIQYSLRKQKSTALVVNLAGKQRMLSQKIVSEYYKCMYGNCDYSTMRVSLEKWYNMNTALQEGDEALGIDKLEDETILANFKNMRPYIDWMYIKLSSFNNYHMISEKELHSNAENFLTIMDEIVYQFQIKSEKDIKTMMIIEIELAIFSLIILIIEVFFIINPIMDKMLFQNKKLEQVTWHQSYAFDSHVKNLKDLKYVLKVERDPERREEILNFVIEELDGIEEVSKNMKESLAEREPIKRATINFDLIKDILSNHIILPIKKIRNDDKVDSLES